MEKVEYGSIVLVSLDPAFGKEINKLRPAIVISNNIINAKSPFCIIVPLTTNLKYQNSIRILIKQNSRSGLGQDSVVICEQIKSVDKMRITEVIGRVSNEEMKNVQAGIDVVLNRY